MKNKFVVAGGCIAIFYGVFSFIHDEIRHSAYFKNIIPLANQSLSLMSVHDQANLTYDQYAEVHIEACKMNAKILEMSTDKPYSPFERDECLKYMHKSRPNIGMYRR